MLVKAVRNEKAYTWYRNLSLVNLIREIVERSDRIALEELHNNRTVFRYADSPPLLFTDFLEKIRERAAKREWPGTHALEVANMAYDLTIDKFSNLPEGSQLSAHTKTKNEEIVKRKGPDCRLYFRAFLKREEALSKSRPPANQLDEENRAAKILQGLVRRHFYLSRLEAERKKNPFWSRYYWKIKDQTVCVWLPVSLKGRERRDWLEENIHDPNPFREGERERIQEVINRLNIRERFVHIRESYAATDNKLLCEHKSGEDFGISLAKAVAEEKARNIKQQRRSIKTLGKEKLKTLILRIFEDLSDGQFKDEAIAKAFGLSKATFSRFAGSHWHKKETVIPDLWLNSAQVLSNNTAFKKVAEQTGAWKQVEDTLIRGTM